MGGPSDDKLRNLAMVTVRALGKVVARRQAAAEMARGRLDGALVDAYAAGATVTELAEASGLTRPTVYRAVHLARRT